jgi:hypothetical protein
VPGKAGPIVCLIIGLILLAMGFGENLGVVLLFTLAGALIAGGGLYVLCRARPSYSVTVTSSGGEIRALTSADKDYISKIVASINEAIVRYR